MKIIRLIILIVITLTLTLGCKSTDSEKEIMDTLGSLSAEEILVRANSLMGEEKYEEARIHYRFIYENFPNSPSSIEALIGLADSLYKEGGLENMIQAFFRYEDFYNRFPQAEEAEHTLYMMGVTTFYQHLKSSLDTTKTREAMAYFTRYLEMYPDGQHAEEAQKSILECKEIMAGHEYHVADYYLKRKAYEASLQRLKHLWTVYPSTEAAREGRLLAKKVYEAMGQPELAEEFPDTPEDTGSGTTRE